jgi:hypothetical protein
MEIVGLSEDGTDDNIALRDCERGAWRVDAVPLMANGG